MKKLVYVVQEHNASHLHWDFRLQVGDVLLSWALPKDPDIEVGVKRLAIKVEDHELEYAKFSGRIPKGQYGAGTVKIWDRGSYEPVAQKSTSITFVLKGKRLKGLWRIHRMDGKKWILQKLNAGD